MRKEKNIKNTDIAIVDSDREIFDIAAEIDEMREVEAERAEAEAKKEKEKEKKAKKENSVMQTLKRARTLNVLNSKNSKQYTVIAESETEYKTDTNEIIKKDDIKENIVKNTIDYRFNSTDDDKKYSQIQKKLADILQVKENTDIRFFESIFNVRETKRYYNILVSSSVILNRSNSIEMLLTESDNEKVSKVFDTSLISDTETKIEKYAKHIKNSDIFSLVLKDKESILKCAELLA